MAMAERFVRIRLHRDTTRVIFRVLDMKFRKRIVRQTVNHTASNLREDKNEKITKRCLWNDLDFNLFSKHRIILRDSRFGEQKVVGHGIEEVMKCMVAENPTLVWKSKLTLAKLMTKWFAMRKACQASVDSQMQTGAPFLYNAEKQ